MNVCGIVVFQWDDIRITGRIVSEYGSPRVVDLYGTVGTCDLEAGRLKVWPCDERDPQLPANNDGKLWFVAADVEAIAVVK